MYYNYGTKNNYRTYRSHNNHSSCPRCGGTLYLRQNPYTYGWFVACGSCRFTGSPDYY